MKQTINKLAVIGSRDFEDYDCLRKAILENIDCASLQTIISGGAKGADALAERFAVEFNIPTEIYPADWKRYGRAAGPKRNDTIVKACDGCIAFTIGPSKGTMDAIKKCRAKNKPVIHIAVE